MLLFFSLGESIDACNTKTNNIRSKQQHGKIKQIKMETSRWILRGKRIFVSEHNKKTHLLTAVDSVVCVCIGWPEICTVNLTENPFERFHRKGRKNNRDLKSYAFAFGNRRGWKKFLTLRTQWRWLIERPMLCGSHASIHHAHTVYNAFGAIFRPSVRSH